MGTGTSGPALWGEAADGSDATRNGAIGRTGSKEAVTDTEFRSVHAVSDAARSGVAIEAPTDGADTKDSAAVSAEGVLSVWKGLGDGTAVVVESDNPAGEPVADIFPT